MHMLYLIISLVALLIGIWLVCQNSRVPRSAPFLSGLAILLLALLHVLKYFPQNQLKF